MSLVTWNEQYFSIHVDFVDEQHKRLLEMLNQLHSSVQRGTGNEEIGPVLREMVAYVKKHFTDEERLMLQVAFPEYERHKAMHHKLTARLTGILLRLKKGDGLSAFELLSFLKDWWTNHIVVEDMKIGRHITSQQKQSATSTVK